MAERPDRDEAAEPDRPEGASETPSADAWSDAVDHPHDGPQDSPTGPADLFEDRRRPRMGFSGGATSGSREPAPRTPGTTTTTISASWGRCSSSCSGGGQGMPDLASWSASSAERGPRRSAARHRGADAPAGRRPWPGRGRRRHPADVEADGHRPDRLGVMAMLQNQMKQMFGAQTLRRGWRCRPTSPARPWRPRPTRR